jgi:hypothetical protein
MLFGYITDIVGNHANLKGFNDLYHFALDFFTLSILAWAGEGLFGDRIYSTT